MKKHLAADSQETIRRELEELKKITLKIVRQSEKEESKLMNFNQAADYLGLSHSYLYKLTCHKLIPCHRPMRRLYFFKEEI